MVMENNAMSGKTIAEIMRGCSDSELIEMLPYIRDEEGQRVSLVELKHYLRAGDNRQKDGERRGKA